MRDTHCELARLDAGVVTVLAASRLEREPVTVAVTELAYTPTITAAIVNEVDLPRALIKTDNEFRPLPVTVIANNRRVDIVDN